MKPGKAPLKNVAGTKPSLRESKERFDPLVTRLRQTFKWYDALLIAANFDFDRDPERLPYIDEDVLTQHYYHTRDPQFEKCSAYLTSGTATGARKRILYSDEDHDLYVEHRRNIFARFLSPECKTACSDLGTGHAAASAVEIFERLGVECFHIDFRRPAAEHIALLNEHRPDVLFTMPMVLDSLIYAGGLDFQPRKIITVGDVASRAWKQRIADFFSLHTGDLLDVAGSIEVGSIAYECFDCGLYHFDDHIIPETVGPSELYDDLAVRGTAELLIVTSLARFVFPAVRFITNDLIEGFTTRECGAVERYSFERMIGRVGSEFKNGENISLYDVNEAVNTFLPASPFEVRNDSGKFSIHVSSTDYTDEIGERIKHFLRQLNPHSFQMIESSLVADIEICNVPVEQLSTPRAKRFFLANHTKTN
jgi:phenylacetate-coenzyme A ligase PaaK-like adenylate-forming protein